MGTGYFFGTKTVACPQSLTGRKKVPVPNFYTKLCGPLGELTLHRVSDRLGNDPYILLPSHPTKLYVDVYKAIIHKKVEKH
jgi:hypothetical protein